MLKIGWSPALWSTDAAVAHRYQYTADYNVIVNNATGDLIARILDTAVAAGGDLLSIQGVDVSPPPCCMAVVLPW